MDTTANHEPRQKRLLIVVLTLSALLTAGHFVTEHHASGIAANTTSAVVASHV